MLKKLYYWFHRKTSKSEERGEYSSGHWQDLVRSSAVEMCRGSRGNLLEIGCGEGLFLTKLAEENRNLSIFGIDIWKGILLKAENRLEKQNIKNVKLFNASGYDLPFKDSFFDAVICINVFFNLPSEERVFKSLEEMMRICKRGGRIIFDIRNRLNPLLFLKYKLAMYYDETVRNIPLNTYRLKRFSSFLENHGFNILNKIYTGFPYNTFSPIVIIEVRKR